jgi:hypothetical protein
VCAERVAAASQPDACAIATAGLCLASSCRLARTLTRYRTWDSPTAGWRACFPRPSNSRRGRAPQCCGRAARASRRHSRAPTSVARHGPAKVVVPCSPRVLARASARAAANGGPGRRVRRRSQGGMRIRACGLLRRSARELPVRVRLRLRLRDWRSGVLTLAPSWSQEAVVCEGSVIPRPGSIEVRRHLRRCSDRGAAPSLALHSYGPLAIGTSFGTLRTSVARNRSFCGPGVR